MQGTVTLSWTNPTVGARNLPQKSTAVYYRAKADVGKPDLPWTLQDVIPAAQSQLVFSSVAPGTYQYRVFAVDTADQPGVEAFAEATMTADQLGAVQNLTATAA